ncbi:universal stress protein Slr1101-like [Mercenaria mercenaria]|uniref:universal stress protein Slr1101-like n=1 Tax=Mercenaria mercenaria TaxID=6596 RepID=UPI001E1DDBE8|nr:universal stress protein Slr1101-like [Mercenaria mercenaria]
MAESGKSTEGKRNIMIAMDCSKHANYAFKCFVENIYRDGDNVIMAHCVEHGANLPTTMLKADNADELESLMKEHEQKLTETFKSIDELANSHNIKHTLECIYGSPGEALVKAAEQQNVDMIIVGSRGHGTIRRTVMGCTSDYIVHHAHVPVMVCKHEDEHHKLK